MADNKLNMSTGNWITIGVFLFGIISAWAKIQVHISDDSIHLTEEQRTALVRFTAIVDEKLPDIKNNSDNIIIIQREFAVFKSKFNFLYDEHEGLESKVSRNYIELLNKIDD
jgi:hypothetical protein